MLSIHGCSFNAHSWLVLEVETEQSLPILSRILDLHILVPEICYRWKLSETFHLMCRCNESACNAALAPVQQHPGLRRSVPDLDLSCVWLYLVGFISSVPTNWYVFFIVVQRSWHGRRQRLARALLKGSPETTNISTVYLTWPSSNTAMPSTLLGVADVPARRV
jgi:hypothetical protein